MGYFRPLSQTKFINDANLVSYWKLEDVNDSKGSNNLTNNGTVTFDSAKFNNGATTNPTGSKYLSITDAAQTGLGVTGSFTISMWVKVNGQPSTNAYMGLVVKESSGARAYQFNYRDISGVPQFENYIFADNTATNYTRDRVTYTLTTGVWYNVIFVSIPSNSAGNKMFTYVNGLLISGTEADQGSGCSTIITSASPFCIGSNNGTNIFDGQIDDVAFFSRALSAGEVAELYQSQTLGEYLPNSNTKLLLHLNGSSADYSGNGNNGIDTAITYSLANGKFGQGAGFNGSTSRIDFGSTVTPQGAFTIGFWINLASNPSAYWIYSNVDNGGAQWGINIWAESNSILLEKCKNTSARNFTVQTTTSTPYNAWNFVVFTWDGTTNANKAIVYLNGKADGTATAATTSDSTPTNNLRIGQISGSTTGILPLNGKLDEIIVDSVAWSAEKIKKEYTYQKGRFGII